MKMPTFNWFCIVPKATIALAFLLAVLIYTNILPKPQKPISVALDPLNAFLIKGKLVSNPTKISAKYYTANFELFSLCTKLKTQTACSTATGKVTVFLGSDLVEKHYPGALYTIAKNQKKAGSLFETGSILALKGNMQKQKDNLGYTFFVESADFRGFGAGLYNDFAFFRAKARLSFKRLLYRWGDSGRLLLALLCGSREYIKKELNDYFRLSGLSFVLALSGMHLALFSGLALSLATKLITKRFAWIFQIVCVSAFVWFAGLTPSLSRSVFCLCFCLLCRATFQNIRPLNILSASFLLHYALFPQDAYTISFVLSYCALFGIFVFCVPLEKKLNYFLPPFISRPLCASLAAQIATAPVCLLLFGFFNPLSPIASLVISPLISVFMLTGLLCIVLCLCFPFFTFSFGAFMSFQYAFINAVAKIFSFVPLVFVPLS